MQSWWCVLKLHFNLHNSRCHHFYDDEVTIKWWRHNTLALLDHGHLSPVSSTPQPLMRTLECRIWRWPSHTVTVIHHNYFMLARSVNCWLMQRLKTARLCPLLYNLINVLMLFVSLDSALCSIKVNRWGLGNDEIVGFTLVSWCFNALIYGYLVNRFNPLNIQIRVNWYFGDHRIRRCSKSCNVGVTSQCGTVDQKDTCFPLVRWVHKCRLFK